MNEQKSTTLRKKNYHLKVILTGDSGVGKTLLATKFCRCSSEKNSTQKLKSARRLVNQTLEKNVEINEDMATLRIMDTLGKTLHYNAHQNVLSKTKLILNPSYINIL